MPENSRPAFLAAIEAGLPIELDLQLSADDQLVVHHDPTLGRLTDQRGPVRSRSLEELTRMEIAGGYGAGLVWGRYIVFSYATYSDGRTPGPDDTKLAPVSGAFRDHTTKVIEKRLKK